MIIYVHFLQGIFWDVLMKLSESFHWPLKNVILNFVSFLARRSEVISVLSWLNTFLLIIWSFFEMRTWNFLRKKLWPICMTYQNFIKKTPMTTQVMQCFFCAVIWITLLYNVLKLASNESRFGNVIRSHYICYTFTCVIFSYEIWAVSELDTFKPGCPDLPTFPTFGHFFYFLPTFGHFFLFFLL